MLYWKCEECDEINPYPDAKVCETCGKSITTDAIHKVLREQEEQERQKREKEERKKIKQEQEKREKLLLEEREKERIRQEQEQREKLLQEEREKERIRQEQEKREKLLLEEREREKIRQEQEQIRIEQRERAKREWENEKRIKEEKRKKHLTSFFSFIGFGIMIVVFYIYDSYRIEQKFTNIINSNTDIKKGYFCTAYDKLYIAGSIMQEGQCDRHKFTTNLSGHYSLEIITSNGEKVNVKIQEEQGEIVYEGDGTLSLLEEISLEENACYIVTVYSDSIDCDYSVQIIFSRR